MRRKAYKLSDDEKSLVIARLFGDNYATNDADDSYCGFNRGEPLEVSFNESSINIVRLYDNNFCRATQKTIDGFFCDLLQAESFDHDNTEQIEFGKCKEVCLLVSPKVITLFFHNKQN